jgi:hypothetical protein
MFDRAGLRGDERAGTTDAERRPRAATTAALSTCKIVVTATPWRIRAAGGSLAGNRYTLATKAISCSAARTWVTKFAGDKLVYSGRLYAPHNIPFFEWAPKMPRS